MKNSEIETSASIKAVRLLEQVGATLLREHSIPSNAGHDLIQWWHLPIGRVAILHIHRGGIDLFADHCGGTWAGFEKEIGLETSLPVSA